jgi:hypothetical protein
MSLRRMSWRAVYGGGKDNHRDSLQSSAQPPPSPSPLVTPKEGVELDSYASPSNSLSSSATSLPHNHPLPLSRTTSRANSLSESEHTSRPTTPNTPRNSRPLIKQQQDASNTLERVTSRAESLSGVGAGVVSRIVSTLSLSRHSSDDKEKERGRPTKVGRDGRPRSASTVAASRGDSDSHSLRTRSQSPFHLRRPRTRDRSPSVGAVVQSDYESDTDSIRPRGTAYVSDDDDSDSDAESPENDEFDPVTEANTERNALVVPEDMPEADGEISDPLGEGQNVVVPLEPYFPTTLNHSTNPRNPRRRKSLRNHEPLQLKTGRPVFQRDRCTITITQGNPAAMVTAQDRKSRRYIVASDISDESRYALEWAIGTVIRDGDELCVSCRLDLSPRWLIRAQADRDRH